METVANDEYELYRGTNARLLDGFLRLHLRKATVYRRAIGFFSTSVFAAAPDEFVDFFANGGVLEAICSPVFNIEDFAALRSGLYDPDRKPLSFDNVLRERGTRTFGETLLQWGIATGRLHIRIAAMQRASHHAIYHEKIGLLLYRDGTQIAFEGSANESQPAYVANFERIVVYRSSVNSFPNRQVHAISNDFEQLWSNQTPGINVVSLHEAFQKKLFQIRRESAQSILINPRESTPFDMSVPVEIIKRPPRLELRHYQDSAIDAWFDNGGCGIYAMATGAGKTITAMATVEKLYQRVGAPLVIIIVAPYLNLVDQWISEAKKFGLDPINCSGTSRDWTRLVDMALYLNQSLERPILSLATTNATFSLRPFQRVLSKIRVRTLLIADEVHNLGARHLRRCLPERIQLRLGLSATPERWMDEEGTASVKKYFGRIVFRYDLKDALHGDPPALCPYAYHPVLIELDEDEKEEYLQITAQLAKYMSDPRDENLSDVALALLLKRARLVACARQKLPALRNVIAPFKGTRYNLVYCGDGRVEVESASEEATRGVDEAPVLRQVHAVTQILGRELGMNVSTYTAETHRESRQELLDEFQDGNKQALVAIRCLDEGVDIPEVRRAFILASSTNPRQFIQRRGRVLRRSEGKDRADIFDFVVVPPTDDLDLGSPDFRVLRSLVAREMARVVEFARLAINGPQATGILRPLLTKLKLLHLG